MRPRRHAVAVRCAPAPQPGYGWVLVGVLALTVTVSYGVLMYAFPVVLSPMQTELGWSQAVLTGGFSVAALASGIAAIPVGRWVDRHGPRVVMTTGSAAATLLVLAWSRVEGPVGYYAVWIGLGACMAAVFYEPAFTVVAHWFREHRVRALTIITLAGGLASTIFVPLTERLVSGLGWREAIVRLALMLAVLTVLPHASLLRRRPAGVDGGGTRSVANAITGAVPARAAMRSRSFRWLCAAFFLSTVANCAIAVHLVPLLLARDWPSTFAASALALLGFAKLPGRLLLAHWAGRVTTPVATIATFVLQAIALAVLIAIPDAPGVWLFAVLFGAGDGAATPARAELVADFFGPLDYGRTSGVVAFFTAAGRAIAPLGVSLAASAFGGYGSVIWMLIVIVAAAAVALACAETARLRSDRRVASITGCLRLPV
jgi:MFS family permease